MRFFLALVCLSLAINGRAGALDIPDSPTPVVASADEASPVDLSFDSSAELPDSPGAMLAPDSAQTVRSTQDENRADPGSKAGSGDPVDADGNPIPLERREPTRILGFMPNFRSVSGGAKPHPPGWKYNFTIATRQATDYSSFLFLGITSLTAEGLNEHAALGKGIGGAWAYSWRGFLDKTDNTYLAAWFLASALHEDTRYYAFGTGHSIAARSLYVISRQAVARTYRGHDTPNIAGLGGKVLTQIVSRTYYPSSATSFGVLATKFGYSVMRDVAFSSIREFYPDAAAHFIRKHREKMARLAAQDAASTY